MAQNTTQANGVRPDRLELQIDQSEEDLRLIQHALDDEQSAYDALYARYRRLVFVRVHRFVWSVEQAEEVAQEVWLKAFMKLSSYDGRVAFATWLYAIATHTSIDHLRRKLPIEVPFSDVTSAADPFGSELRIASPDSTSSFDGEFSAAMEACLDELNELDRTIVLLRYVDEEGFKELAQLLRKAMSNIHVRCSRARRQLRDCLQKKGYATHVADCDEPATTGPEGTNDGQP